AGRNRARVTMDPGGGRRPPAGALPADGARRLVVTTADTRQQLPPDVETVSLATENGTLSPAAIIAALAARGFRRMLIEGGADTVSRFVAAHCLDRLHVLVAPLILGAGRASLSLPPIARVDEAMRLKMRAHTLDGYAGDVLLDCDLSTQRAPIGRANMST